MSHPDDVRIIATLRAALAEAEARLKAQGDAVAAYFAHYGAEHEDKCPEDDTCKCPLVVAINKTFDPKDGGA